MRDRSKAIALALALAASACAGSRPADRVPQSTAQAPSPAAPLASAAPTASIEDALTKMGEGRLEDALVALSRANDPNAKTALQIIVTSPGNRAPVPFNAVVKRLPKPPFVESLRASGAGADKIIAPRLAGIERPPRADDDERVPSLRHHYVQSVEPRDERVPTARTVEATRLPRLPSGIRGHEIAHAIVDREHTLLLYGVPREVRGMRALDQQGRIVVALRHDGSLDAAFDLSEYLIAPKQLYSGNELRVLWARAAAGVLYLQHTHNDAPRMTEGQDAYVTALALPSGELLWRSRPLVARSLPFVLTRTRIISVGGAGDPDHIVVLDQHTGRELARKALGFAPARLFIDTDGAVVVTGAKRGLAFRELAEPEPTPEPVSPSEPRAAGPEPLGPSDLAGDADVLAMIRAGKLDDAHARISALETGPRAMSLRVVLLRVLFQAAQAKVQAECAARIEATAPVVLPPPSALNRPAPPAGGHAFRVVSRTKRARYLLDRLKASDEMAPPLEPPLWLPNEPHAYRGHWMAYPDQRIARVGATELVVFGEGMCMPRLRLSLAGWTGVAEARAPIVAPHPIMTARIVDGDLVAVIVRERDSGLGPGLPSKRESEHLVRIALPSGAVRWVGPPANGYGLAIKDGHVLVGNANRHDLLAVALDSGRIVASQPISSDFDFAELLPDGTIRVAAEKETTVLSFR